MAELAHQKQVTSKFAVASILLSEAIVDDLRRELRRLAPGLRIEVDFLRDLLEREVIKRELVEGEEADAMKGTIRRLQKMAAREREKRREEKASQDGQSDDSPQIDADKPGDPAQE